MRGIGGVGMADEGQFSRYFFPVSFMEKSNTLVRAEDALFPWETGVVFSVGSIPESKVYFS